jgi:hypothetical protein
MKKKINAQHYLTDALITSDEWDSFDYNLRMQIKELGQIDYDAKPLNWKKNTLAFGYLYHIKNLLLEKSENDSYEIKNIQELETLIEKYDHLKTFLLGLRIATIGYRAGIIPRFVTEGEAFLKRQRRFGQRSGQQKSTKIKTRDDQIRKDFQKIHIKNPRITPSGFAKSHADKYGLRARRIQDILKTAVGS